MKNFKVDVFCLPQWGRGETGPSTNHTGYQCSQCNTWIWPPKLCHTVLTMVIRYGHDVQCGEPPLAPGEIGVSLTWGHWGRFPWRTLVDCPPVGSDKPQHCSATAHPAVTLLWGETQVETPWRLNSDAWNENNNINFGYPCTEKMQNLEHWISVNCVQYHFENAGLLLKCVKSRHINVSFVLRLTFAVWNLVLDLPTVHRTGSDKMEGANFVVFVSHSMSATQSQWTLLCLFPSAQHTTSPLTQYSKKSSVKSHLFQGLTDKL